MQPVHLVQNFRLTNLQRLFHIRLSQKSVYFVDCALFEINLKSFKHLLDIREDEKETTYEHYSLSCEVHN